MRLIMVLILLFARPYEVGSPLNRSTRQAFSPLCQGLLESGEQKRRMTKAGTPGRQAIRLQLTVETT
jgi:hypothetical protein